MINLKLNYGTESAQTIVDNLNNKIFIDSQKSFPGKIFTYLKGYISKNRVSDILKKINSDTLIEIHRFIIGNLLIEKNYCEATQSLLKQVKSELKNRKIVVINPSDVKILEPSSTKNMDSREIIDLLKWFAFFELNVSIIEKFERAYKKYGSKILDLDFLLSQIEKIQDPKIKQLAHKYLFYFRINLLGHEIGMGGNIKLNPKNFSLKQRIQNWINSFLGQNWKIEKRVNQIGLENNFQINMHLKVAQSLKHFFLDHTVAIDSKLQRSIINSLESTAYIRDAKFFGKEVNLDKILEDIRMGKTVTLPSGWAGHAVTITISGNKLAYANRGQASDEWSSGIQIYTIGNLEAINKEFLMKICDCEVTAEIQDRKNFLESKKLATGMYQLLQLRPLHFIEKQSQKVGNCSWVSAKCAFQAQLFMHEFDKISEKNSTDLEKAKKLLINHLKILKETEEIQELKEKLESSKKSQQKLEFGAPLEGLINLSCDLLNLENKKSSQRL